MRWLLSISFYLLLTVNLLSQRCTIIITPDTLLINDELITLQSIGQFEKLFGKPDSISTGIAFANRQIEVFELLTHSFKPKDQYGIEIRFAKADSGYIQTFPRVNYFTGSLTINGQPATDQSVLEQFSRMNGWKFTRKMDWEDNTSYAYENKTLKLLLRFKDGTLLSVTLVPTKKYLAAKR